MIELLLLVASTAFVGLVMHGVSRALACPESALEVTDDRGHTSRVESL